MIQKTAKDFCMSYDQKGRYIFKSMITPGILL